MYALALDGELVLTNVGRDELLKALAKVEEAEKIEVASFQKGRGWVPLCVDSLRVQ